MQNTISMVRGATKTFNITLTAAGQPYVLAANEFLRFGVKESVNDTNYLIEKILTSADYASGKYKLKLVPSDTINLKFKTYVYDIGLQSNTDYFSVVPSSPFIVNLNVTKHEVI